MRRELFAVLLTIAAAPAYAQWTKVSKTVTNTTIYADFTTVVFIGDTRQVWEVTNLEVPLESGVRSFKILTEYDCKTARRRTKQVFSFLEPLARGTQDELTDYDSNEWEPVENEAGVAEVQRVVCIGWKRDNAKLIDVSTPERFTSLDPAGIADACTYAMGFLRAVSVQNLSFDAEFAYEGLFYATVGKLIWLRDERGDGSPQTYAREMGIFLAQPAEQQNSQARYCTHIAFNRLGEMAPAQVFELRQTARRFTSELWVERKSAPPPEIARTL